MKMIERNKTAEAAALLIHPMLSSAEGIELCVTDFWGDDVRCFLPGPVVARRSGRGDVSQRERRSKGNS